MTDLFSKFDPVIEMRSALLKGGLTDPFNLVMEKVESPTVAICNGRRTILLGTYNYMGMTFDSDVVAAGKKALDEFGSGTTGSRVLNVGDEIEHGQAIPLEILGEARRFGHRDALLVERLDELEDFGEGLAAVGHVRFVSRRGDVSQRNGARMRLVWRRGWAPLVREGQCGPSARRRYIEEM